MAIFKRYNKSTSLPNSFLQNKDISLQAKGLLGYMLSLPDNWKFTIEGIASCTGEKPRKIIAILHELTKFGYHIKMHNYENGRIKEWIYYTFAEPRQDIIDGTFSVEKFEQEQQCTNLQCCSIGVVNNNINIISNFNDNFILKNKIDKNSNNIQNNSTSAKKLSKKQQKELLEQEEQVKINNLIDQFTDNVDIKELLEQYVDIRKQKGILTSAQFTYMLEDLKKYCGSNVNQQKLCLRKAIAGGWSQIVFLDNFKGTTKTSYSSFDNTAGHFTSNPKISDLDFRFMTFENRKAYISNMAVADMTREQREFFEKYCLARDENGNILEF